MSIAVECRNHDEPVLDVDEACDECIERVIEAFEDAYNDWLADQYDPEHDRDEYDNYH